MRAPRILYRLGSRSEAETSDHLVVLVNDMDVLVSPGNPPHLPSRPPFGVPAATAGVLHLHEDMVSEPWHCIADWDGKSVWVVDLDSESMDTIAADSELIRLNYRDLFDLVSEVEMGLAARALQIARFSRESRFCPRCGNATQIQSGECVARCGTCGYDQYPRMSPAMIVAIVRDRKILLAQSPRYKGKFHSVLAGFVEPGESVEDCIHREVCEEVGIEVTNIRYFGSQSWPFPHSLMLAYTAEWSGGDLKPDPEEIVHADWYPADDLPPVPGEISISGRMIRWFTETYP